MRTRDLDEAVEEVTKLFCPHTVAVLGRGRIIDARLEVKHAGTFRPVVELAYEAPVTIDTDVSKLLIMHCARGSAAAMQQGRTAEWRRGQTMPFSVGLETRLQLGPHFVAECVLLDIETLETLCSRWLGRPLDRRLRFALRPFSPDLEQIWQRSLAYLRSIQGMRLALAPAAKGAFDEFLLTLLLHQHPHNFSEELAGPAPAPVPSLVRKAERFMADHAETPITVSDVAGHLGVSLRTLQAGFRNWRDTTPTVALRQLRLQRVRDDLLRADRDSDVTTVALRYGFAHLSRFSAHYRSAFGETPSATLRRGRSSSKGG
ncbi:AraC family transcriptional regulator [Inquilinus sp.]|jgi:AraC-like DNA-binding protein|uniref:AraC family transcriptional regulator n=1 Tax=Inquilinus sp. TaxID=1932117 RepID=UPI003784DA5B